MEKSQNVGTKSAFTPIYIWVRKAQLIPISHAKLYQLPLTP